MQRSLRTTIGLVAVLGSMAALFILPREFFVILTMVSTACMTAATVALGGYRGLFKPSWRTLLAGLGSAALLYLLFLGGNMLIGELHPLGIGRAAESAIYSLIASPANPLAVQVAVLIFDSVGYESYFRGFLQKRAGSRLKAGAPFLVAGLDSAIHILTLNPLWVATTFVVDSAWGLTYYFTKDLSASVTSHFCWDILIFVVWPIR